MFAVCVAGHSFERAYKLLPALSALYLCQMACYLLLYPLPDEAVVLKLNEAEKVEAYANGPHGLISFYLQSEFLYFMHIDISLLPYVFFILAP